MKIFYVVFLVFIPLIDAKFEGKFDVKRGGQEPWRPFQTMKLLEEILRKDKVVHRASMTFKTRNRKLRELVTQLTEQQKPNKISNRRKTQNRKFNRFRNFHKRKN